VTSLNGCDSLDESGHGTSRHFAAAQQFGRIWSEADVNHRARVHALTRPMPEADLAIMRRLDRLHLASLNPSTPTRARSFTGAACTGLLIKMASPISMDGRGVWRDNVFIERHHLVK
jgi:hypothetical protein